MNSSRGYWGRLKENWGSESWGWLFLASSPVLILFLGLLIGLANLLVLIPIFAALIFIALLILFRFASLKGEAAFYNRYFDNILANLSDAVVFYDNDFKVTIFNQSAETLFGLRSAEVLGQKLGPERLAEEKFSLLTQIVFPSLAPVVLERSAPGAFPQVIDLSFENPTLELRTTTNRLSDRSGRPIGFVKIVRSRTPEVALAKQETDFVTVAAHQLRTPLTAVKWTFENLASDASTSADNKAAVQTGLEATEKLMKTVDDLLSVAKIEGGKFGYNFEEKKIGEFIGEIVKDEAPIAKAYGVELSLESALPEDVVLKIDSQKLSLAMENLIVNAVKYNVRNGTVTVKIEKLPGKPYVLVSVADTGIGIPPEDMKKLFTKFFRAQNAVSLQTEGTGMGLYITRAVVLRHGGQIWAESTLGRGTTFYIALPTDFSLIPTAETPTFL